MGLRATVEAASAYELVLSMAVASRLGKAATASLVAEVAALGHGSDYFWAHLLTVAVEAPPPRDGAALLAHLETIDVQELRRRLAGYYVRWFRRLTPPEVMVRALRGDSGAQRTFLSTADPQDTAWQAALEEILVRPGPAFKSRVISLVGRWHTAVGPWLNRRQPLLRREAARWRLQRKDDSLDLIAKAAGIEYIPEPAIERVLLIPSFVIHPDRHVFDHLQLKLICYPLQPPDRDQWESPAELVSLLQALASSSRLQLIRMIARNPASAQQVAEQLGVPITTALHHLDLLRAAGVLIGGDRRGQPYAVNAATLTRIQPALQALL